MHKSCRTTAVPATRGLFGALAEVPAAIFVLTQDNIRRSGASTSPEVLSLAPGLEVERSVGARVIWPL